MQNGAERSNIKITPSQEAQETRQKNIEAKRAKEVEKHAFKSKIKEDLLSVVDNKEATPAQKLEAPKLLMELI